MRIASLSPAATEILFGLGFGLGLGSEHQIVCTDQFSNFPEDAKSIPHVHDMVKVDPAELAAFHPDVVLLGTSIQAKLAEHLRSAGFSVVFHDPRTIEAVYGWIRSLGALFDRTEEAEAMVLGMQQGFNDVKRKAAVMRTSVGQERSCPTDVPIYIEEWPALPNKSGRHDPPFASGNWVPEIARIAGGRQFPIADGELSRAVTLEEVEQWNPDLIVISWCGAGTLAPKELLLKRPGWDAIPAVREGRIRVIDDSLLNRPGPRLVEGARHLYGWIFEMVH